MTSLGRVLNIGHSGLNAAAAGTSVTSNNITNAATPGYTRRMAVLSPNPLEYGGGARVREATRVEDRLVETRILSSHSLLGESKARARTLRDLDLVLQDGAGGVVNALDEFESALAELSAQPSEPAVRQVALAKVGELADAFNRAGAELAQARDDANTSVAYEVAEVNTRLQQIGDLTRQIVDSKLRNVDPSPLIDQRDTLIHEVADRLPVKVIEGDNNAVELLLGGSYTLVDHRGDVNELTAAPNANGDTAVFRDVAGVQTDMTALITSGSLRGLTEARDGALLDASTALDQLAEDITTAYNAVHTTGFGTDGVGARNLFDPAGTTARSFAVSADVAGQPEALAAGATAGVSGDNTVALQLSGLRDQRIALTGSASASGAFASLIGQAGSALSYAYTREDYAGAALEQVEQLREQVSGVNMDEEMISMMRFQRAYQASLNVVTIADSLLAELINMR